MYKIEAFTCCDTFPVPQFILVLSSQVRKESVCSCVAVALKQGCLKRLGLFITRNRVALRPLHFGIHTMHGESGRLAQEKLTSGLSQCGDGSASLPCMRAHDALKGRPREMLTVNLV